MRGRLVDARPTFHTPPRVHADRLVDRLRGRAPPDAPGPPPAATGGHARAPTTATAPAPAHAHAPDPAAAAPASTPAPAARQPGEVELEDVFRGGDASIHGAVSPHTRDVLRASFASNKPPAPALAPAPAPTPAPTPAPANATAQTPAAQASVRVDPALTLPPPPPVTPAARQVVGAAPASAVPPTPAPATAATAPPAAVDDGREPWERYNDEQDADDTEGGDDDDGGAEDGGGGGLGGDGVSAFDDSMFADELAELQAEEQVRPPGRPSSRPFQARQHLSPASLPPSHALTTLPGRTAARHPPPSHVCPPTGHRNCWRPAAGARRRPRGAWRR